jgi:4-cresol dehydrogenase (hydroxylating)
MADLLLDRPPRLVDALQAWSHRLGPEAVLTSNAALAEVQTATFATTHRVHAVLRPRSREEVQASVRIADEYAIPLYPVSAGKNWGFGSSVPSRDGCVVLHLGRLNRIVAYDEDLAYVTVEPGVTQGQLHEFLRQRGGRLWLDASGSTPESSLIGNVAERGVGFTPYADHFSHVCDLEVVLPGGEYIRTGFGRFDGAAAAAVHRYGVGPALDGLFAQSGLGIITRMTLWLMPAPEAFQACYFNLADDGHLDAVIGALRSLKLDGTLRGAVHLYNTASVLTSYTQFPYAATKGSMPIEADVYRRLCQKWDLAAWHGSVGMYGSRNQVHEARRRVRKALAGHVSKLEFLDDRRLRLSRLLQWPYRRLTGRNLSEIIQATLPGYGLLRGVPTDTPSRRTYWRKHGMPPADVNPDRDRCGFIWCTSAVPLVGHHVRAVVDTARAVLSAHQFEPQVSLNLITDRCAYCMIAIVYDRDMPRADLRASRCHAQLNDELRHRGYYPYRLGVQDGQPLVGDDPYGGLLRKLKDAIDPNDILATDRYV